MLQYKNKKLNIRIINVLVVFFAVLILNITKTSVGYALQTSMDDPSLIIERTTEKSIILNLYKNKDGYSLQETIKVTDGAKSSYIDDYKIYEGKRWDGKIVSFSGKSLGYFPADDMIIVMCWDNFNPNAKDRGGCKELPEGDIQLRIPYFPNGKYVDIYNPQGEKIFTADLSTVAVCNENNVCENSEDISNCPSDCQKNEPAIDTNQTQNNEPSTIAPASNQTEQDQQKNKSILYIIIAILGIVAGIIIFFWIKKKKRSK